MCSKLWHYYHLNREDFLRHYHLRSNAEPAFCMIKAKFGGACAPRLSSHKQTRCYLRLCATPSVV
jgi:hypothetical protein